jgi:hypothetical protein
LGVLPHRFFLRPARSRSLQLQRLLWHHAFANAPLIWGREMRMVVGQHRLGDAEKLVTTIRTFCNADVPDLMELWLQHWSSIGAPPQISAARFEQAILARTFFDPKSILLAESDGVVVSWCHYAPSCQSEKTAVICALCIDPSCDSDVSQALLTSTEKQIVAAGFDCIQAGVVRDDRQGYAGLDPIGHGIGIPVVDARTGTLLQQSGFAPWLKVTRMAASTFSYRPRVSREALQLRRTSEVRSDVFRHSDSRHAAGMSHLDIEIHRLLNGNEDELARVNLWVSDPEAEVMIPSMAILDIQDAHQRGQLDGAESYLIGAMVQSLGQRRIDTVQTVVDSDKVELVEQLQSLQFRAFDEGVCWTKSLV